MKLSWMLNPPSEQTNVSAPNRLDKYCVSSPRNPNAMAISAVFLYPILTSMFPAGMPINRYARKFIIFPIIPRILEPAYWFFQIVPKGAARFVTNEIIAKRKNIVIIATTFPFCFFVSMNYFFRIKNMRLV